MGSAVGKTRLDSAGAPASPAHVRDARTESIRSLCRSTLSSSFFCFACDDARRPSTVRRTFIARYDDTDDGVGSVHQRPRVYWVVRNALGAAVTLAIVDRVSCFMSDRCCHSFPRFERILCVVKGSSFWAAFTVVLNGVLRDSFWSRVRAKGTLFSEH